MIASKVRARAGGLHADVGAESNGMEGRDDGAAVGMVNQTGAPCVVIQLEREREV